jgi:hypothetical protein
MPTYVLRDGKLIEKHLASPRFQADSAPGVISDTMGETRHMASGKYFTSKAAFRAETKAYGCREVGNEVGTLLKPRAPIVLDRRQRRDDIKRTIYDLKNGIKRG